MIKRKVKKKKYLVTVEIKKIMHKIKQIKTIQILNINEIDNKNKLITNYPNNIEFMKLNKKNSQ